MRVHRFSYILIATLTACVFTTLLTATAKFSFRHPNASDERFEVNRDGTIIHQPTPPQGPVARAVADETEHDFGLMNPLTMGKHSFVVRNHGDAPLKLQAGPTSCKCTLSDVSAEPIPPGGQGQVTVEWNTGRKNRFYAHEASVYTNDPKNKNLTFAVRGVVRVQLGVEPPQAMFDRIKPDAQASTSLLVYSQVWDAIQVVDIQSSLDGLSWTIEPADVETMEAHEALSACWLRLTTPSDLPEGSFSEWLQFRVLPPSRVADAIEHQVALTGKTLKRLSVYGPGIDVQGEISMGSVTQIAAPKRRFLIKVRDTQTELPVESIETTPEFLNVRVVPGPADGKGLNYLELAIPPGSPRRDFLATVPAQIRITFDHPRIAELKLTARFAIVE